MPACSAQKRAEKHLRKAVALCPELVQMKAHTIDTVLTVEPWADCTAVSLARVLDGDTLYAATPHGTVVVSLRQSDSALRVGFVAAPLKLHYRDTLNYAQVTGPYFPVATSARGRFWRNAGWWILGGLAGLGLGMWICLNLLRNAIKNDRFR